MIAFKLDFLCLWKLTRTWHITLRWLKLPKPAYTPHGGSEDSPIIIYIYFCILIILFFYNVILFFGIYYIYFFLDFK
jgi:hypothetical protein